MKIFVTAIAAISLGFAVPALAQEMPLRPAEYVEVTGIHVDDGHTLDYAKHLATIWRQSQDFSMRNGWITGYEVLLNSFPREGEPNVYLLTRFTEWEDAAEGERRQRLYQEHMSSTMAEMEAASAGRAEYRRVGSSMLLRRMTWRD